MEESFKIIKSFLDARPVYLQKQNSIYGHFLICYLTIFLLKVLEIKIFNKQVNSLDLIKYIRGFNVTKCNERFINRTKRGDVLKISNYLKEKEILKLSLTESDIKKILNFKISRTIK